MFILSLHYLSCECRNPAGGRKVELLGSNRFLKFTTFSPMRRSRAVLIKKLNKNLLVFQTIELNVLACLVLKSWLAFI